MIEIGTQTAYRFWRYVYVPGNSRLLSWTSDRRWYRELITEGTNPDIGEQGIHGFKTLEDMTESYKNRPEHLVIRSQVTGCDGVVFGTVEMWGTIWDHEKGYRARFARPASFDSALGEMASEALADLRRIFFG